jgi:hypothetical protein
MSRFGRFEIVIAVFSMICSVHAKADPINWSEVLGKFDRIEYCMPSLREGDYYYRNYLDKVEVRNCFDGFIEYYSNFTTADGLKAPSISNAWDIPDIKGISLCYRTARLLNARQKLEDIADFLGAKWAKLGESAHYDKGEKFIAQAPGILHELRMALMSEEAWVRGFNNVQKLDESYWNAKCAGFFGLNRESIGNKKAIVDVNFTSKSTWGAIVVTGVISSGFTEMLESHVNANRFNKWVVLSSLGGDDVFEAMKAGKFIRERGLWDLIGKLVDIFKPDECANYFRSCGYDPE